MKKYIILLLTIFMPLNIFAYSDKIIPGGNTLGIEVDTNGILIIGFYKINGKYNKSGLKAGDYILKVNDEKVYTSKDLSSIMEKNIQNKKVEITYIRSGKIKTATLNLIENEGKLKTGLYIKENIKGTGTLSYIDPETNIFGALGHEVTENTTASIVEIKSGFIFDNYITKIEKSKPGYPGSKIATFNDKSQFGTIFSNTKYGIFGSYNNKFPQKETMEVTNPQIGQAIIRTVITGNKIEEFKVNIKSINETSDTKNLTIEIIDQNLLNMTGGVVQGMSGSPIIQNNKIVGVLTHVIVDNPSNGYGIFITTMLEAGENN